MTGRSAGRALFRMRSTPLVLLAPAEADRCGVRRAAGPELALRAGHLGTTPGGKLMPLPGFGEGQDDKIESILRQPEESFDLALVAAQEVHDAMGRRIEDAEPVVGRHDGPPGSVRSGSRLPSAEANRARPGACGAP